MIKNTETIGTDDDIAILHKQHMYFGKCDPPVEKLSEQYAATILPVYFHPDIDETLFSWLHRLSKANCIDSLTVFYRNFIDPNYNAKTAYVKADDRICFPFLYSNLKTNQSMAEVFLQTTCYGALAPMLSSEHQIKQINASFRQTAHCSCLINTPKSLTPNLMRCPQCQEDELQAKGYWYYHRAHQLPGVFVCHKHGCPLQIYTGKKGHEFDEDAFAFASIEAIASKEVSSKIAIYAKALLDNPIDANMEYTKYVIMQAIKAQGYYNPESNYEKLSTDIRNAGLATYFPHGINTYMKKQLMHVSDAPPVSTIALIYFLFPDIKSFTDMIYSVLPPIAQNTQQILDGTSLIYNPGSTYRHTLLELKCTVCGHIFCTTENALFRGWGCPNCDSKLSPQALFERIVRISGHNEYKLLSPFTTMEGKVRMQHSCGSEFEIKPRKFIHDGTRCRCADHTPLFDHCNRLDFFGDLMAADMCFPKSSNDVNEHIPNNNTDTIKHFSENVSKDTPFPATHTAFTLRVQELVGDEYTVTGQFQSYRNKISIRHNACGKEAEYIPQSFLRGQRCAHCRSTVTPEFLLVQIPALSGGTYIYGGPTDKGKIRIINTKSQQEVCILPDYALQELTRPTPSRILPCDHQLSDNSQSLNLRIQEIKSESTKQLAFLNRICRDYINESFIFLDEFTEDPEYYKYAKQILQNLSNRPNSVLKRIYPGIYTWSYLNHTPGEIIRAKYCQRRDKVIGYSYGQSFAHELGIRQTLPDKLYFTTMKESNLHGRDIKNTLGIQVHVRGSRFPINCENYIALQFLDLLPNLGQYIDVPKETALNILREYARCKVFTSQDFDPFLSQYPKWVPALIEQILST